MLTPFSGLARSQASRHLTRQLEISLGTCVQAAQAFSRTFKAEFGEALSAGGNSGQVAAVRCGHRASEVLRRTRELMATLDNLRSIRGALETMTTEVERGNPHMDHVNIAAGCAWLAGWHTPVTQADSLAPTHSPALAPRPTPPAHTPSACTCIAHRVQLRRMPPP